VKYVNKMFSIFKNNKSFNVRNKLEEDLMNDDPIITVVPNVSSNDNQNHNVINIPVVECINIYN